MQVSQEAGKVLWYSHFFKNFPVCCDPHGLPSYLSVKNLPAMQETQIRFLGQEDPLEKEMAIHSSILAWKISWTGESGGLQSMGSQELDTA